MSGIIFYSIIALIVIVIIAVIIAIAAMFNFDDDAKFKIMIYVMIFFAVIAVIGLWELFIKPIALFIRGSVSF